MKTVAIVCQAIAAVLDWILRGGRRSWFSATTAERLTIEMVLDCKGRGSDEI